jgi:hypothetical protein
MRKPARWLIVVVFAVAGAWLAFSALIRPYAFLYDPTVSERAAETNDRDRLEGNTELKIPTSATDIHGYVDGFHHDEPQAAMIVIMVFAGLLGFVQPQKAWRWALIVGPGVPMVYLIATALGYHAKSVAEPGGDASLIALIPAFIGTYGGVLLRKVISTG